MNWLWASWQPGQRAKPVKLQCTLEQAGSRAARGEAVFPAECGHGCERGLRQCAHTPGLLAQSSAAGNGVLSQGCSEPKDQNVLLPPPGGLGQGNMPAVWNEF